MQDGKTLIKREFEVTAVNNFEIKAFMIRKGTSTFEVRISTVELYQST